MPIHSSEYPLSFLPPPSCADLSPCHEKPGVQLLLATHYTLPYISGNAAVKLAAIGSRRPAHSDALEDVYDVCSSLEGHCSTSLSLGLPSATAVFSPQFSPIALDTPEPTQTKSQVSQELTMPKKRRSLQAILVPSFFQSAVSSEGVIVQPPPSPSMRLRAQSAAASTSQFALPPAIPIAPLPTRPSDHTPRNSPPSDLLDEDPFADLSPSPSTVLSSEPVHPSYPTSDSSSDQALSPQHRTPRSPLSAHFDDMTAEVDGPWRSPPRTPPSTPVNTRRALPGVRRPRSSGHGQVRPAYTRPAFSSRPSLPSLSTLAQMHVIVPKVKSGRVGAKLPAEPWELASPSSTTASSEDEFDDVNSESRHFSRLSTIRDSCLFTEEPEALSSEDSADAAAEGEALARSTTPKASLVNRSSTPSLLRAQSDPTSSHSGLGLLPDGLAPQILSLEELNSSPETSFPSTPQSSTESSGPSSHDHYGYFGRFSHHPVNSIYDDLAATLEYDYGRATADLQRPPSLAPLGPDSPEDECEFEPGTSARTVRNFLTRQSIHSAHQRTVSAQSATIEWTPETDGLPISPVTMSSFTSGETSSSATSSDNDDAIDFHSFRSDSDEEETNYVTSMSSHEEKSTRSCTSPSGSDCALEDFEHGASSGVDITVRLAQLNQSLPEGGRGIVAEEATDAGEGGRTGTSRPGSNYPQSTGSDSRGNGHLTARGSGGNSGGHGQGSGSGRPGKDGNDDWNRRPTGRTSAHPRDDTDTSEDEETESSDDDEGQPASRVKTSKAPQRADAPSSDDDVPLAQQIPSALRAQRTIRRQVKDEHAERRRVRSVHRPSTAERSPPISPIYAARPLPMESLSATVRPVVSSSHEIPPQSASAPVRRPRTKTMPSQPVSPFSIGELTKKLLHVQTRTDVAHSPSPQSATTVRRSQDLPMPRSPMSARDAPSDHFARANLHGDSNGAGLRPPSDISAANGRRLLPMRSFHRPRTATSAHEVTPPVPLTGLGRSATTATRKHHDHSHSASHTPAAPSRDEGRSSLDRVRSTRSQSRRPSAERSSRPSAEHGRPPMPTLPSGEFAAVPLLTWQQRIFIVNLQRYCQVELNSSSTAKDILEILLNQRELDGSAAGWMVWELSQDFGMERPIRSFETVTDVTKSWMADKTVNVLMARKTALAAKLSRAAIPSSSPICSGFVQWEHKRGKWQKRWLELREHSLWLSKRDNGKDEQMLCSLNNFDAYIVTRVNKAPKPFVFAVKSTDNLSYFESTADYVHVFSCGEPEGQNWLEKILLARSYILHKDHVVLSSGAAPPAGAGLSRAGTRKRPAQPLVNFGGPITSEPPPLAPPVFEPGSLLAKRGL